MGPHSNQATLVPAVDSRVGRRISVKSTLLGCAVFLGGGPFWVPERQKYDYCCAAVWQSRHGGGGSSRRPSSPACRRPSSPGSRGRGSVVVSRDLRWGIAVSMDLFRHAA